MEELIQNDDDIHKQGRRISDEDIKALAHEIHELQSNGPHLCRFASSNPEELKVVIMFVQQLMAVMDDSKKIVRKTILVGLIWAFGAVLTAGTVVSIQKIVTK